MWISKHPVVHGMKLLTVLCYYFQAAEEEAKETEPEAEAVQTTSTPTPSETTEPESADRLSTVSSNTNNPDTDPVEEGHEPKSASNDNNRTEEENNRTDNDVDEGVDLQGTVDDDDDHDDGDDDDDNHNHEQKDKHFLVHNKATSLTFLRANSQRGAAKLTIAHRKQGRVVLLFQQKLEKDCSPKPAILCILKTKIKKIYH